MAMTGRWTLVLGASAGLSFMAFVFGGVSCRSPFAFAGSSRAANKGVLRLPALRSIGSGCFVGVEVRKERIKEFLKVMEEDVTNSRDELLEPGCLRFDLLRSKDSRQKFICYQCFADDEAEAYHKTTPHHQAWMDFKASGGLVKESVARVETKSLPPWAFQVAASHSLAMSCAILATIDIRPGSLDDFLEAMKVNLIGSRNIVLDAGCLRIDLLRHRDTPNRFILFEAYRDDKALDWHRRSTHNHVWTTFKADGGVIGSVAAKFEAISIPRWAFVS